MNGNALLELLLTTPIAAIVLFGATDIGMRFLEEAKISDLVRVASLEAVLESRGTEVKKLSAAAEAIAKRLLSQLKTAKQGAGRRVEAIIEVAAVRVPIDEESGVLRGDPKILKPISRYGVSASEMRFSSESQIQNFIEDEISQEVALRPSPFAVPLAPGGGFAECSVFFFVAVRAFSNGLNGAFYRALHNGPPQIDIRNLLPVRNFYDCS